MVPTLTWVLVLSYFCLAICFVSSEIFPLVFRAIYESFLIGFWSHTQGGDYSGLRRECQPFGAARVLATNGVLRARCGAVLVRRAPKIGAKKPSHAPPPRVVRGNGASEGKKHIISQWEMRTRKAACARRSGFAATSFYQSRVLAASENKAKLEKFRGFNLGYGSHNRRCLFAFSR